MKSSGRILLAMASAAFFVVSIAATTQGQDKDLAAEGKAIAENLCGRCHAVGKSDVSKLPIAPPFRTFAAKWPVESLEEALAEGIITGHPDMPVFEFEPDQIAALIEHLHAIAENPKPQ